MCMPKCLHVHCTQMWCSMAPIFRMRKIVAGAHDFCRTRLFLSVNDDDNDDGGGSDDSDVVILKSYIVCALQNYTQ